jgi:hypothetical protein
VVSASRRNGNLRVLSDGTAEVGAVEIHGPASTNARRRAPRPAASFGQVVIDGNLGSFASDLNVRTVVVDGILGDLDAPGRQINQLHAGVFDVALADAASVRTLDIEQEMSDALFDHFLPEDESP